MGRGAERVVLYSKSGYSEKHDSLLSRPVGEKILLFCAGGKDCELRHDAMDELFAGSGGERDFFITTIRDADETPDEVVEFARNYAFRGPDNAGVRIIEI